MTMYLEFLTQNWFLFVMLAAILLLLAFDPSNKSLGGARKVSASQLPMVQSRQSAVVVDIRSKDEFRSGHIAQSINLPLDTLGDSLKKLNKYKGKPLILVCQTGARVSKAAAVLKSGEFSDLYALDGGIAAWTKENLPLSKG